MIKGIVTAEQEIVIRLTVRGPSGRSTRVQGIVDTGFDNYLTLPAAIVGQLGLPWRRRDQSLLADGSAWIFDVYEATVVWDRRRLLIPVYEAEADPLVGTALMNGYELNARFETGGEVTIRRLRRRRRP
jgi:clan AA aspartic protease